MHNVAYALGRLSTVLEKHGERGLPIDPDLVVDLAHMLATLAVLAGREQPAGSGPNIIHVDFINRPPNGVMQPEGKLMDTQTPETRTDGVILFNGIEWMTDAKGSLVPLKMVKDQNKLEDQLVRKIMDHANDLNAQIGRFKTHTNADLASFDSLISEKYGAKVGGPKGNRTYQRFDGLAKIEVKVADLVDFGPELQVAKTLIDECLNEWSVGSRPEIQSIVTRAFNTDQEGKINRSEIYMLLRHEIEDDRWKRAMEAIVAAMRVTGSKEYIRFYQRASIEDGWTAVTIDMAKA